MCTVLIGRHAGIGSFSMLCNVPKYVIDLIYETSPPQSALHECVGSGKCCHSPTALYITLELVNRIYAASNQLLRTRVGHERNACGRLTYVVY